MLSEERVNLISWIITIVILLVGVLAIGPYLGNRQRKQVIRFMEENGYSQVQITDWGQAYLHHEYGCIGEDTVAYLVAARDRSGRQVTDLVVCANLRFPFAYHTRSGVRR